VRADDVAVAIPTRDRWKILTRTLEALRAQTVDGFQTIVVADGLDQRIPDALRRRADVRVLVQPHAGPGMARNLAARSTDRPLVLFLGDDTVPTPSLVSRHLAWHRRQPASEVAVLGHVDWHPEVGSSRLLHWLDWSGSQFEYRALAGHGGEDVGFGRLYASNLSIKRGWFLEAGGFDPDFRRAAYEDTELGWRLHQRGLRLIYEPDAVAHHLHRYEWADMERRYATRAEAERLMCAKHPGFSPWFLERIRAHAAQPPVSRLWPLVVDYVPRRPRRLRRAAEIRADRWYHQRLAPAFLEAWERAGRRGAHP
jgi:GT2 family glycosyltransferase